MKSKMYEQTSCTVSMMSRWYSANGIAKACAQRATRRTTMPRADCWIGIDSRLGSLIMIWMMASITLRPITISSHEYQPVS